MTDQIGTGTAQGVIEYLDSLVAKGRSRDGVVSPLKTALTKVLEKTEGEDKWTQVDVTNIDLDDTMLRFKNFTLGTYTEASYRAYHLRIQRAITWYKKFLENPGWAPQRQTKQSAEQKSSSTRRTSISSISNNAVVEDTNEAVKVSAENNTNTDINMIVYPFPLTDGNIARLYLPKKVSKVDATRLSSFINALILDDTSEN